MPVAPYGSDRYREWNAARMRRYREGLYGVREYERRWWHDASDAMREMLVRDGVFTADGVAIAHTVEEMKAAIRAEVTALFGAEFAGELES
jgi:hypothetical protein